MPPGSVGRWIGTIKPRCFFLAGLVSLSADHFPLAASGAPTEKHLLMPTM